MSDRPLVLSYFRDRTGHEVDLIVEQPDGTVLAIEVKSAATVHRTDGKALRFLRDRLGDRLIAGIILHTGPLTIPLDDRIRATPISAPWGRNGPNQPVVRVQEISGSRERPARSILRSIAADGVTFPLR